MGPKLRSKDHGSCSNQRLATLKQPRSKEEEGQRRSLGCSSLHPPPHLPPERAGEGERRRSRIIPPSDFVQAGSPGKSRNNHRFDTKLLLDMSNEQDEDRLRRRGNGCCKS